MNTFSIPTFKQFLEARSHSEQNLKISAYEALKKYKDDPDIYISFTKNLASEENQFGPKIGLNPSSKYNTPLAVYCYPLQVIWKQYNIDKHKTLTKLPFASELPNIFVLRAKGVGTTFINDMHSDYGSDKYDKDVEILRKIWLRDCVKVADKNVDAAKTSITKYSSLLDALEEDKDTVPTYEKLKDKYTKKLEFYTKELDSLTRGKLSKI